MGSDLAIVEICLSAADVRRVSIRGCDDAAVANDRVKSYRFPHVAGLKTTMHLRPCSELGASRCGLSGIGLSLWGWSFQGRNSAG
jgi:hypothetical protein